MDQPSHEPTLSPSLSHRMLSMSNNDAQPRSPAMQNVRNDQHPMGEGAPATAGAGEGSHPWFKVLGARSSRAQAASHRVITRTRIASCLFACGLGLASGANAAPAADASRLAPLFDNLGDHHHRVTTESPQAQRYFDQGLVLLYGFNHEEAIRSFQAAFRLDPKCAMAQWGIAYAYGPNINRPMDPTAAAPAWAALEKARELAPAATPAEQAYIEALSKRYRQDPVEDRTSLDTDYANATREVMRRFPDDPDAAVLFAEAVMDTTPWNYWDLERVPKPVMAEVLSVLRQVLRRDPDHPGANHFFIHAVEAGPTPEDGLPSADRLRRLHLGAAHLIHMPSHIYLRMGRYGDAIDVNALASEVDHRYVADCRAQGFYPAVYYPHNLHFLWFADLCAGRFTDALKAASRIQDLERDVRCGPSALLEAPRFRHLTLLTLARFGRWDELAREPEPAAEFPLDRALWHFTQGLAAAARKDADAATRHLEAMQQIGPSEALKKMDSPFFPATQVFGVAEAILKGKSALAHGDSNRALDALRRAVTLEDSIPYMEPPFWHAPARLALGAALLALDQPADAEAVFRADLNRHPGSGWSLAGLQECLRRKHGSDRAAEAVTREFGRAWERADGPIDLAWF